MSEPRPPAEPDRPAGAAASPAARALARAEVLELEVEQALSDVIERGERSLAQRFGAGFVRGLRFALRATLVLLVLAYFVFGALLLAARWWVLPQIDRFRPQIEAIASRAAGAEIRIGHIEAGWDTLNPRFSLEEVRVGPVDAPGLALPRVDATLSWISLVRATPIFSSLVVRAPEIALRRLADGRIEVAGFALDPAAPGEDRRLLDWLLAQQRILVTGASLLLRDERNPDAPRALDLHQVELLFEAGFAGWRFGLQAVPPADLAAPFDLRGRFSRSPFEAASDWRLWSGALYAEFDDLDLARLTTTLDLPWQLSSARGASRVWLDFERMRVTRVAADVALAKVQLRLAPDLAPLALEFVRGRITQAGRAGEEVFGATGLAFRTQSGLAFGPADLALRLTEPDAGQTVRGEFSASRLEIGAVAALLPQLPMTPTLRDALLRHGFTGELTDLLASWQGPLAAPQGFSVRAGFSGLSSRAQPSELGVDHAGLPGFAGLTGQLEATQAGGSLRLASRDLTLEFPGVFDEPRIPLTQLDAALTWTTQPQLEVKIESASLRNADLDATAAGTWRAAAEGQDAGSVDLSGRVLRLDAASAWRYVPTVAGRDTIVWLQQALRAGQASDGQWRLRGRLHDFPFTDPARGDFRVSAKVAGVMLDYVPGGARDASGEFITSASWPALTGIEARLLFEREALDVWAQRGAVQGMQIQDVHARIPRLAAGAVVQVKGDLAGPLAGLLRFANASPVGGWLGHFLEGAEATGPTRLGLELTIPLAATARSQVAGSLKLQGNELRLAGLPPFARATGAIGFTESSVSARGLAFNWLGGAARLDASTLPDGTINLSGNGRFSTAALRSSLAPGLSTRLLERAQGEARYSASLGIKAGALSLRAESDLVGIALNLPAPLKKAAGEAWPLRVSRQPGAAGSGVVAEDLRVSIGSILDLALERQPGGAGLQVTRGSIGLGTPAALPAYGLSLNGSFNQLDLDAWIPAVEQILGPATITRRPGAAAGSEELSVDLVALRAREVVFDGKRFANVVLGATHTADGSWNANLASDSVSGALNWRPAGGRGREARLAAQFSRLAIPESAREDVTQLLGETVTARLPAVELSAEQFELGTRKLGRLELTALYSGPEQGAAWTLQTLAISNPDARLSASGQWALEPGGAARRMALRFVVDVRNAGGLLDRLGIRDALKGGSGKLEGETSWRGSPLALHFPTLDGKLALELERGQFLKAEPGAARLLSVLSLQSVARRLTLDFRDLFSDGFAFDSVRADARLAAGVLTTSNFRMIGPAATVLIEGSANLRAETQNLRVVVLPDINAGSASIALAVLNPALGLGSFLAQLVLKDPLAKLFSLEYDVSGTWSDPQVRKVERGLVTPAPSAPATPFPNAAP